MIRNRQAVPALMFHSVGLDQHPWVWSYLSEPVETFEAKMALLARRKFTTIFWDHLYGHMAQQVRLPPDSILLTFDDGYLDNWVYVYPILKKYGLKATISVNPEFVDPSEQPRPNLEDVWAGRCAASDLQPAGFLSWEEMRLMERSGVVDVQSHAMTHTWHWKGPRVLDWHAPRPVAKYPWLAWNVQPERKPFYLSEEQQAFVPWGHPIFEHERALVVRRFLPDPDAVSELTHYVQERGGPELFDSAEWRRALQERTREICPNGDFPGTYESDEDRRSRLETELVGSKQAIEKHLEKEVRYICWPAGGNDATVRELAREAGYKAWTLASVDKTEKRNVPGADPVSIKRMGTSNSIRVRGRECGRGGARFQMLRILAHQGSLVHAGLLRAYKLAATARALGGRA